MPRRKEIRGISSGIASSFVSRNNDIDGYWAMGIFYQMASEKGDNKFVLDLVSGKSLPEFRFSKRVALPYHKYLLNQLEKKDLEEFHVTDAIVELEFNIAPTKRHTMFKWTWGEPFKCRVTITDDLGKKHAFEEYGWCGQHDPAKERRSTRRYAF
jgi:hypothetical protein